MLVAFPKLEKPNEEVFVGFFSSWILRLACSLEMSGGALTYFSQIWEEAGKTQ
jgi:hypothetical protein